MIIMSYRIIERERDVLYLSMRECVWEGSNAQYSFKLCKVKEKGLSSGLLIIDLSASYVLNLLYFLALLYHRE